MPKKRGDPPSTTLNAQRCREYYLRHRKERIAHQKKYYKEHREEVIKRYKAYAKANPDWIRAKARLYRENHIDQIRKYDRERGKRPERREQARRTYQRNVESRRLRMAKANQKILREAKHLFGDRCLTCNYDRNIEILQFDHVVPPKKTGRARSYIDRNISALEHPKRFQLLCPVCHAIKSAIWKRVPCPTKGSLKNRRRREKLIKQFGSKCSKCGYNECYLALQLDHIIPIKNSRNRSGTRNLGEAQRNPESFQLLCANCHAVKNLSETKKYV